MVIYYTFKGVSRGVRSVKDYGDGIEMLESNCYLGDPNACATLGFIYLKGTIYTKRDITKAIVFFDKACDMGQANSCSLLGSMYLAGVGVLKDYDKALEYLKRGCELGDEEACNTYYKIKEKLDNWKEYKKKQVK